MTETKLIELQAYVWQCGSKWCIQVKLPSGQWRCLTEDWPTRNQAIVAATAFGLTLITETV